MPDDRQAQCWEVLVLKRPVLTVHRASKSRALEYAEAAASRLVLGTEVKLRCVRRCVCSDGKPQAAVGATYTVTRTKPEGSASV